MYKSLYEQPFLGHTVKVMDVGKLGMKNLLNAVDTMSLCPGVQCDAQEEPGKWFQDFIRIGTY